MRHVGNNSSAATVRYAMKYNSLLAVIYLLVSFSNANLSLADAERESGGPIIEISMERTGCLGRCPADEVVLRSDGTATYIGKSDVKQIGVFTGYIPTDVFKYLSDYLIAQKFFEMSNIHPGGPPETDGTFINAVRDGKVKTLRYFEGPSNHSTEQWAIATVIRGVAADIDWQKHKSGIYGVLTTRAAVVPSILSTETSIIKKNTAQPDKPFLTRTRIDVQRYEKGHTVLYTVTDADGNFEIDLPPGTYFLTPNVNTKPFGTTDGESLMLTVGYNTFNRVTLEYKPKPK